VGPASSHPQQLLKAVIVKLCPATAYLVWIGPEVAARAFLWPARLARGAMRHREPITKGGAFSRVW